MKPTLIKRHAAAARAAFPLTVPVLAGYMFLGLSYGVLMASRGFSPLITMLASLSIYGGSIQYALVGLLTGAFSPVETFILAFVIDARHIFYGISMLDKYKGMGLKKLYLIFAMTDETFSVNYIAEPARDIDRGLFYSYISLFDHSYWVTFSTLGCLFGSLIPTDIKGFDFAMTALFVVILLEQLLEGVKNLPSVLIGVGGSALALLVFGAGDFLIPAMVLMLLLLAVFKKPIDSLHDRAEEEAAK